MLIGITGHARHGKDSVANLLVERYGFTKLGFADAVREMAVAIDPYVHTEQDRHFTVGATPFARYTETLKAVGYEKAKSYGDVRRLLQRIGTEAGRALLGDDVWVNAMARRIGSMTSGFPLDANIVINDVRFENEARMVKDFGGHLIRVVRPNFDNGLPPLHASETAIDTLGVDYELIAEAFDDLLQQAENVFGHIQVDEEQQRSRFADSGVAATPYKPIVYLAAPWVCKDEAAAAKQRLIAAGIEVISGWTERENTPQEIDPKRMVEQAILDRNEVAECNTIIVLGLAKSEGKATELGMALGSYQSGRRIILVKEDRAGNIFYHLPEVERVDTLEQAIELLKGGYATAGFAVSNYVPGTPLGVVSITDAEEYMKNTTPAISTEDKANV